MKRLIGLLPHVGLFGLLTVAVWSLTHAPAPVHAQTAPKICRAAMIIDRSGSVDQQNPNNMQTIRNQIRRLFEPTGLYNDKIELAFWSFSDGPGNSNYDAPYHGYVSSKGITTSFNTALNSLVSTGATNYQQAFGYNGNTRNPALNDIINETNILVFMTDGDPNRPNPNTALELGRQAAQKHLDAGRVILGGAIGLSYLEPINYTITGNRNDASNTFTISTSYDDLSIKLKQQIGDTCKDLFPPEEPCPYNPSILKDDPNCKPPQPAYTLKPLVSVDNTVISSDESAGFQYRITNESPTTTTPDVGWSIKRVVVDKAQSADPLLFGADTYRDGYSCAKLVALINSQGTCQDNIASGTKQFPPGNTVLSDLEVGSASRLLVDDRWPVGTKVCYVLALAKPTEKDAPVDRYSRAACVVIGKRPSVQVWGADLNVGSIMPGDPEGPLPEASKINTGLTVKDDPINRIFGSWAEYGAFAPGSIIGLGTASKLESGYPGTISTQQGLWSDLTFANKDEEYGSFAETRAMPNIANALLANQTTVPITTDTFAVGSVNSGVYEKQTPGGLTLSGSTLGKGKSVVVYVPNDTVTIDGDLAYTDEPLGSVNDIPRLVIIARAINVKGAVNRIDAWLIARNNATGTGGGVINTCSDGPAALTITDCDHQLRINGLVMARQLLLRRTAGAGSGAASDQPGEIINLRADAYLSSMARGGASTTVPTTTYSVELPPRF